MQITEKYEENVVFAHSIFTISPKKKNNGKKNATVKKAEVYHEMYY